MRVIRFQPSVTATPEVENLPARPEVAKRRRDHLNAELLGKFRIVREAWREETDPFRKRALYDEFRVLAAECEKRGVDMRD